MIARRRTLTARSHRRPERLGVANPAAFAAAVAARRSALSVARTALPMPLIVFACVAPQTGGPRHQPPDSQVAFAPRLTVAVSIREERHEHVTQLPLAAAGFALGPVVERRAAHAANLVVTRFRAREVRREVVMLPSNATLASAPPMGAARALDMPLTPRRVNDDSERAAADARGPRLMDDTVAPVVSARAQLPATDLARLTDTVLRSLDQRIAAQRERLGRR